MGRPHPQDFVAIAEGFGDMVPGDVRACFKIGKCASHAERPMEAANQERERVRRLSQKSKPVSVRTSGLIQQLARQIRIRSSGYLRSGGKPFRLKRAGCKDARAITVSALSSDWRRLSRSSGEKTPVTTPQVWLDGNYVGGADALEVSLAG
jgi:hypothetical protein